MKSSPAILAGLADPSLLCYRVGGACSSSSTCFTDRSGKPKSRSFANSPYSAAAAPGRDVQAGRAVSWQ